jgi:hypothetical protein
MKIKEIPTPYVTLRTPDFNEICRLVSETVNAVVLECAYQSSIAGKPVSIQALEPGLKLRELMKRLKDSCLAEWNE